MNGILQQLTPQTLARALGLATLVLLVTCITFIFTAGTAHAATYTWSGTTDGDWNDASNWGGSGPPTDGDDLIFSGITNPVTNNDLAAGTDIAGIQFTNSGNGENFTLAGNAIDLTGDITTTANASNDGIGQLDTISLDIQLTGGDRTFTTNWLDVNDRHDLTVSGIISEDASARALIKEGSAYLYLTGDNTYTGATTINSGRLYLGNGGTTGSLDTASAISIASGAAFEIWQTDTVTQGTDFSGAAITGAGQLRKSGAGTLILNTANSYSGGTAINAGTLNFQNSEALGTGRVDLFGGGVLEFGANSLDLSENVRASNNAGNRIIRLDLAGTNTGTLSGTLDIRRTAAGEFDIDVGLNDTLTVSNPIVTQAGGGAGLTKEGDGTLSISGSSTYV